MALDCLDLRLHIGDGVLASPKVGIYASLAEFGVGKLSESN